MNLSARLEKAIRVAAHAHRNQRRKGTEIPYIIHPFSTMLIASDVTSDEDTLIACLFHDILEDVPEEYRAEQMDEEFDSKVVEIVKDVSKDYTIADWQKRSEAYLGHLEYQASDEAVLVSIADKTHNLLSILSDYEEFGDAVWQKFNSPKEKQLWWYQSVLAVAKVRLPDSPLLDRFENLTKKLEEIVAQSSKK